MTRNELNKIETILKELSRNMKKEDKQLLVQDLCARLPYGVIMQVTLINKYDELVTRDIKLNSGNLCYITNESGWKDYKPYLFPLSSMTDELWEKEFCGCGITEFTRDSFKYGCETLEFNSGNPNLSNVVKFINLLIKNHFDVNGLIPKGLAIDATNLNIY